MQTKCFPTDSLSATASERSVCLIPVIMLNRSALLYMFLDLKFYTCAVCIFMFIHSAPFYICISFLLCNKYMKPMHDLLSQYKGSIMVTLDLTSRDIVRSKDNFGKFLQYPDFLSRL